MTFDPGLVARIADALESLGEHGIRQKNVFGGRGFLVGKHTFVIAWGDGLIAKLEPDDYSAALAEPGVTPFSPAGGRAMGTWVVVGAELVAEEPELVGWVRRALRAVGR